MAGQFSKFRCSVILTGTAKLGIQFYKCLPPKIQWVCVGMLLNINSQTETEGRSSDVQRPLLVLWVDGSILVDGLIELFSFKSVLHNWCNKGSGMYYPVCGIVT